ncbi:MAG: prenyltransferase/squalene oxidase repeat-containing protein [Pirellulales bacterium]
MLRRWHWWRACGIGMLMLVVESHMIQAGQADVLSEAAGEDRTNAVSTSLRKFYARTAAADGSFRPGIDPEYVGMSDSAYSDLAPVTYAVIIHKTFGWELPNERSTREFLLGRQRADGAFYNRGGTVDPESAQARVYNTTQGLVALRAMGARPRHDALPVFADVLEQDYKTLPAYTTSFFPLAYAAMDRALPAEADHNIRKLMVQEDDGYTNDHIAATFHAAHYYRLRGEPSPAAEAMVERTLRDQKSNGSWLINPPARDRHATFDAVFVLRQLGHDREDCRRAIERAARWALSCRNPDGGFGHFPGSTSDADAVYFHVGTLVMAGVLKPVDPLPADAHLLGWGHLMALP